jgi:hypothetical protein
LPKPRVVRVRSPNGEIHIVFADPATEENNRYTEFLDKIEIGKLMKKEASKPLLLLRSE